MLEEGATPVYQAPWLQATWQRRRYIAEDGVLRPVGKSQWKPEYDPFTDGYFPPNSSDIGKSLYLELLEVDPRSAQFSEQMEAFTNRWGLLGLFQHHLLQARYFHVSDRGILPDPEGRMLRPDEPLPGMVQDVCAGPAFSQAVIIPMDLGSERKRVEQWRTAHPGWGTVTLSDDLGRILERPLEEYYAEHGLWSGTGSIPGLRSPELWDRLVEPLEAARQAVAAFRSTWEAFKKWRDNPHQERWLSERLHANLRRVHPAPLVTEDQHLVMGWSFPSLLSAAYMMMFIDHKDERLRPCPACGKPFVAQTGKQKYCSRTCLNCVKQRNYRAKRDQGK